ncbi:hypothetical protein BMS3Abin09_01265 [bacterium BMS3Abin09]|nr:hypothetical protein BMS3Abin09_01265 [bacterium BMS3Abin09]
MKVSIIRAYYQAKLLQQRGPSFKSKNTRSNSPSKYINFVIIDHLDYNHNNRIFHKAFQVFSNYTL